MVETLRYSLIGRQDVKVGTGTFEVELADGRRVILSEINFGLLAQDKSLSTVAYPVAVATHFSVGNASAKIQAAIDSLPSTGGTVDARGLEGAQTIASTVTLNKANTRVILGAATFSGTANPLFDLTATFVTLDGGGVAVLAPTTAGNTSVRLVASDATVRGIEFVGTGTNSVDEIGISSVAAIDDVLITENKFRNMTRAIDVNTSAIGTKATNWKITENFIHDILGTAAAGRGYGIIVVDVRKFLIENNHFQDVFRHAVYLSAGTSDSIVSGNIIDGTTDSAAIILNAVAGQNQNFDNLIVGNHISDAPFAVKPNENSHRTIIAFNKIKNCTDTPIHISNDGGSSSTRHPLGTVVAHNDFFNETPTTFNNLIRATDGDGTQVLFNTGNVNSAGGSAGALIKFDNADSAYSAAVYGYVGLVRGNNILSDANVHGVRIDYASATQRVIVENNEFRGIPDNGSFFTLSRVAGTFENRDTQIIRRTNGGSDTILRKDFYFGMTGTTTATFTLPPAAQVGNGKMYIIKDQGGNAGTNNLTIDGDGTETIDGAATILINTNYGVRTLISDGSNWFTI